MGYKYTYRLLNYLPALIQGNSSVQVENLLAGAFLVPYIVPQEMTAHLQISSCSLHLDLGCKEIILYYSITVISRLHLLNYSTDIRVSVKRSPPASKWTASLSPCELRQSCQCCIWIILGRSMATSTCFTCEKPSVIWTKHTVAVWHQMYKQC